MLKLFKLVICEVLGAQLPASPTFVSKECILDCILWPSVSTRVCALECMHLCVSWVDEDFSHAGPTTSRMHPSDVFIQLSMEMSGVFCE